jgi:Uma2 family endonuclease
MALPDLSPKLTYDDYLLFPEDGLRHEILDGEHYVAPSPFLSHQDISSNLHSALGPFIRGNRLGKLYAAPTDVVLSSHDIAVPDLVFVSNERLGILKDKNIQGAPDLVIEIISPSTRRRDEGIKLQRYEAFGIQEYWMFYPDRKSTRVYRREGGRLRLVAELSATARDILSTPLLPGLEIPLIEIFE